MIWWIALGLGCTSDPVAPSDSGTAQSPSTPLPTETTPETGTWDENDPVGLIELQPSEAYFGPVTVWWQQREPFDVRVEFRVGEGEWQSSPVYQGIAGINRQSIIGIPVGATAEVQLVGAGDVDFTIPADAPITTPALPAAAPVAKVSVDEPAGWADNGRYFLASINEDACSWCTGRFWVFVADRQGTVYWATRSGASKQVLFAQISTASGDHLLWDEISVGQQSQDSLIHRTYLDREIETIPAPGHHHAFVELPDGTLAWGDKRTEEGEAITELRPGSDELHTVWTCQTDWIEGSCRSNALWYDPGTNRYWFSFYTQRAIVEIDRASGTTVWSSFYGPDTTLGAPIYRFDPADTQFDWQHGVAFLDNGNLLVATDRPVGDSGDVHTLLAEYEIDREASVLREVWSYNPGEDARFNGDTRKYPNGNRMHALGARSIAYEVDDDGNVVWQVEYADGKMLGRLEFFDDLWSLMSPPPYNPRADRSDVARPGPANAP